MSSIDKLVNKILLINIALMLTFCVICALVNYRFVLANQEKHSYIFENSDSAKVQAAKAFGSFFLLNNAFIPIDLAVGLEMGKSMYIFFFHTDAQMTVFDEEKKELVACSVKNFNLHEDLAQLDYVFCDKTGTLTRNELIFKSFKILGQTSSETDRSVGLEENIKESPTARKSASVNDSKAFATSFQDALNLIRA